MNTNSKQNTVLKDVNAKTVVTPETVANNLEHKNLTPKNKLKQAMKDNINELLFDSNYFKRTGKVLNELKNLKNTEVPKTNTYKNTSEPHYFGLANKIVGFVFLVYLISGKLNEIRTSINAKSFDFDNINNESEEANTSSEENDFKKFMVHILFYLIILSIIIIINIFIFNFQNLLEPSNIIIHFITNNLKGSIEKCIFGFNISVLLLISPPSVTFLFTVLYTIIWFLLKERDGSLLKILTGIPEGKTTPFTTRLPIILLCTILLIQNVMYFYNNLYLNLYLTIFIVLFIIIFLVLIIRKCLTPEYRVLSSHILLGISSIVVNKPNNNLNKLNNSSISNKNPLYTNNNTTKI